MYSQTHLPGYLEKADELKARGIEVIACVTVNDSFVMEAWARVNKTEGKVCSFVFFHTIFRHLG